MNLEKAREILKHRFGYDSFRMNQEAAIETVLNGRDCVALMPTGGGKSLCYQIPAMMMGGLTPVVPPLIAVMLRVVVPASMYESSVGAATVRVPVVAPLAIVIVAPPVNVTVTAWVAAFVRLAV